MDELRYVFDDDLDLEYEDENPVFRQDIVLSINTRAGNEQFPVGFVTNEGLDNMAKDVEEVFNEICRSYVFQLEDSGKDGEHNYHFQCRVKLNLNRRYRPSTLKKQLQLYFYERGYFYRIHCSPTSGNCRNFDYVMKSRSRVKGPWKDDNFFHGDSILPEDQLEEWHHKIIKLLFAKEFDWRTIHHVLDYKGGNKKSSLVRYLLYHYPDDVGIVNSFGTASQVNSSLVGVGKKKLYLLDLPRSYSWLDKKSGQRKWHNSWPEISNVIEKLKDGILVNSMYGRNDILLMDPPAVVIFSNWPLEEIPGDRISADRLEIIDLNPIIDGIFIEESCASSALVLRKREGEDEEA